MDSMRSLNSSLPSSRPRGSTPPDLLQAFRTAALSVTNLYKSAAADQASSRQEGYQDALEDLLKFLDSENLGVQDGEGWKIRQWATQRYEGGVYDKSPDTDGENAVDGRHSTPLAEQEQDTNANNEPTADDYAESEHGSVDLADDRQSMYHFHGTQCSEPSMQTDDKPTPQVTDDSTPASPASPVRVDLSTRGTRSAARTQNNRRRNRSSHRDFTFTAGTKRKLAFPDFFDISNIPDRRDGQGGASGSKRGRFI